jgi:hypothetical protein
MPYRVIYLLSTNAMQQNWNSHRRRISLFSCRTASPVVASGVTALLFNHSASGRFGLNELPTQITIVARTAIAAWQNRHAVSHKLPPP